MTANSDSTHTPLNERLFLKLSDAAGTTIACVSGCLWVTRDGCLEDTLMTPGQRYLVDDARRVVVTAFGPSLAQVSPPAPRAHPARRALQRWVRRLPLRPFAAVSAAVTPVA